MHCKPLCYALLRFFAVLPVLTGVYTGWSASIVPSFSQTTAPTGAPAALANLIPMPVSVTPTGESFELTADTDIVVTSPELTEIGQYLAERFAPATGFTLHIGQADRVTPSNAIVLSLSGDESLGGEGYELTVTLEQVTVVAHQPAGVFWGVQTLRQLLPPAIESTEVQPGPWTVAGAVIVDTPRFEWRGVMLDVARHFFAVEDVKRLIDLLAYYKINRLHLHLTDDQGWRIEIQSWPELTAIGGSTEVGGGDGGFYTQAEYAEIVGYAQSRHITVVPEVDMPGHTNAALASYAELNCDGQARDLYTGTAVGFSSLCVDLDLTYAFIGDVIRELAALTPGPYIHIGGDESQATAPSDYVRFIDRVQAIVESHGKQTIGWEEIAQAALVPATVVQHWNSADHPRDAVEQGAKVILSPATKAYLDMKYDATTRLGLTWAGTTDTQDSYGWEPASLISGVSEEDILGVEAALWSETLESIGDIAYMIFPRLPGIAEIGWSPVEGRAWDEYRLRLASHGPRLDALGVDFYRDPDIEWE